MPTSPNVGHYPFPFKHIPDVSAAAAREIRRNFEAVFNLQAASEFDAIIDPTLTASNPSLHFYKNLTELAANETWDTDHTFHVGVKAHHNVPIVEPGSAVDISTRGDLVLFGLGGPRNSGATWNLLITTSAAQTVFYHNLGLGGFLNSVVQNGAGGTMVADGCFFYTTTSPVGVSIGACFLNDCYADGSLFFQGTAGSLQKVWMTSCLVSLELNFGTRTQAYVQGGAIGFNGGNGLTITGVSDVYAESDIQSNLTITSTGSNVSVVNTGVGTNVSVSSTAPSVSVYGDWTAVSFTGVSAALRRFQGSGDSIDFTGPGQVIHTNKTAGFKVKLRGVGVQAMVMLQQGAVQCLSLVDSQVMATFATAAAFTLDASSTRCLCLLSGTHQAGWVFTTNSGTNNRIITETDDTFVTSPPAAGIPPSILNGEIAAVQSGVYTFPAVNPGATAGQLDAIHKDLIPAVLVGPQPGMQLIPAAANTGATAAQLDALAKDFHEGFLLMGG